MFDVRHSKGLRKPQWTDDVSVVSYLLDVSSATATTKGSVAPPSVKQCFYVQTSTSNKMKIIFSSCKLNELRCIKTEKLELICCVQDLTV